MNPLTKLQWAAVLFVSIGVLNQILNYGEIPWIGLTVATTFALYGFVRKKLEVDSLNGLLVETALVFPIVFGYIIWQINQPGTLFLNQSLMSDVLLIGSGIITALPLIWFAASANKIPLNGIGFLQFIAPTISFILATQLYAEPLGSEQLISFSFIWFGILLYLIKPLRLVFARKGGTVR